ncbi:hypothetical protein B0H10DRAFT_2210380 [Mycena sp. CBHHK59/15]|nr:hypothetical protein B0H10DRAFT_2210380 [Mycena sp. CBHHK59/15]
MEYQLGLLARLTDEVRDTDDEDSSVAQVIISTAPHQKKTLAFNYASLALNNSFFLGQLTQNVEDTQEDAISQDLLTNIITDHGGLEQLKSSVSAAAMGMFTSGWVWFVSDKNGRTSILPTFGPGTLLVRSRTYMGTGHPALYHDMKHNPQDWDPEGSFFKKYLDGWEPDFDELAMNSDNELLTDDEFDSDDELDDEMDSDVELSDEKDLDEEVDTEADAHSSDTKEGSRSPPFKPPPTGSNPALKPRFLHTTAHLASAGRFDETPVSVYNAAPQNTTQQQPKTTVDMLNAGEVLYPLFCISVHEHAWITAGYGVWGKEAWLREFWNVLNWRKVSDAYQKIRSVTQ